LRPADLRSGTTLVEMLVSITVAGAIAAAAVSLIAVLLRADVAAREKLRERASVSRLARQFRADVRTALAAESADAEPDAGRPLVRLALAGGGAVEYRLGDERIVREETAAQGARRVEAFALPKPGRARVTTSAGPRGTMVRLTIEDGADPVGRPSGRVVEIDAALGVRWGLAGGKG
jgi:hypothetical protein